MFLNSEFLLAAQWKYYETTGKRDIRLAKNALQQSLQKVQPDSTSCNASCISMIKQSMLTIERLPTDETVPLQKYL